MMFLLFWDLKDETVAVPYGCRRWTVCGVVQVEDGNEDVKLEEVAGQRDSELAILC